MKNLQSSLALVDEVIILEDKSGVDLKVILQPSLKPARVRLGWDYIGPSFGMFVLPEKGDEILVVFAEGDLSQGVAIKRLSNLVDKLPDEVGSDKVLIVGKSGHDLKVEINGNVDLKATGYVKVDSDDIQLGNETMRALATDAIIAKFNSHTHPDSNGPPDSNQFSSSDFTGDVKGS